MLTIRWEQGVGWLLLVGVSCFMWGWWVGKREMADRYEAWLDQLRLDLARSGPLVSSKAVSWRLARGETREPVICDGKRRSPRI